MTPGYIPILRSQGQMPSQGQSQFINHDKCSWPNEVHMYIVHVKSVDHENIQHKILTKQMTKVLA